MPLAKAVCRVVIKVVSSLTPDDENVCAPALLQLCVNLLAMLPIAYAVRIETVDKVFQHSAPDACLEVSVRHVFFPVQAPDLKGSLSGKAVVERQKAWEAGLPRTTWTSR